MKLLFGFILLLTPSFLFCQRGGFGAGFNEVQNGFSGLKSFYNVVNSEPITAPNNPKQIEGSPFFQDIWMKGIITLRDGNSYSGQHLKLDMLDVNVRFLNPGGQEKVCTNVIDRVILLDTTTDQVYTFVHSFGLPIHPDLRNSSWLEVLAQGHLRLFKQYKKELSEQSQYAGAPVERIKTSTKYFLMAEKDLYKVNSLRDLQDNMKSHQKEIADYIKKEKPSWKNEQDIIHLVSYYNSLFPQ